MSMRSKRAGKRASISVSARYPEAEQAGDGPAAGRRVFFQGWGEGGCQSVWCLPGHDLQLAQALQPTQPADAGASLPGPETTPEGLLDVGARAADPDFACERHSIKR